MRANDRKHLLHVLKMSPTREGQPALCVSGDVLSVSTVVVFVVCSTFVHNLQMSGSPTEAATLTGRADVHKS